VYGHFFDAFSDRIKVRKREIAESKLSIILPATFRISARKGFHAMSLRDLCQETGLSMGGIYNYFGSKEELSEMINRFVGEAFAEAGFRMLPDEADCRARMDAMIRSHIYMAEQFQPWYYFMFMEAKSLPEKQRKRAIENEQRSVDEFASLIETGITRGLFRDNNPSLTASSILALTQEWYLKRGYFRHQGIETEAYADYVVEAAARLMSA
jgi:AcrR family transcriptional regulator